MSVLEFVLIFFKFITLSVALLSAGGIVFYNIFYLELVKSRQFINNALFTAIIFAIILSLIYLFLDAARFSGSIDGIIDYGLQKMILQSHLSVARLLLILGLLIIVFSHKIASANRVILTTIGVSLVVISFTYTGHTSENPFRIILAPLLIMHLFVVIFWFGALIPLYFIIKIETNQRAGLIVNDFSKKATFLVPLIFIAGIILSIILMEGINFLRDPYGQILLLKITVFSILMLIAALNKLRLGPDLELGKPNAARNLQRAIIFEILFIFVIVGATTILTGFFSPETT
tara:strand:- start:7155 stop:8021 length:867 start_codon:yes stop_codon:yes gene_type:complete